MMVARCTRAVLAALVTIVNSTGLPVPSRSVPSFHEKPARASRSRARASERAGGGRARFNQSLFPGVTCEARGAARPW